MRKRKAVLELEESLVWFVGRIGVEEERHEGRFDSDCQTVRRDIEAAKEPLQDWGFYDELVEMLARAQSLVHDGRYDDADAVVLYTHDRLIRKSGTLERLERRFGGLQPEAARMPRPGHLVHGFGPPEPDAYQGKFFQRATAGEIGKVVAAASQLRSLMTAFALIAAGRDGDLENRLARAAHFSAAAEVPLEKLGLQRMLVQTFDAVRSLCAERDYPAAEELVDELFGYLQERLEAGHASKPGVQ